MNAEARSRQRGSVAGGAKLRELRKQRGFVQLDLDVEEVIGARNYNRIELGKAMPSREKLNAILEFFAAGFNDRQAVFKAFGYGVLPSCPLPNPQDVTAQCQPELDAIPAPAYLVDPTLKLLAANGYLTRLLGNRPYVLDRLKGQSLLKARFQSWLRMKGMLEDEDLEHYLLNDVRAIRDRLAPYRSNEWCETFINELCAEPVFDHYWNIVKTLPPIEPEPGAFTARVLHPLLFVLPGSDAHLNFRSNPEKWHGDRRLELVTLEATDSFTMRYMERWRSDIESSNGDILRDVSGGAVASIESK